MEHRHGEAAQPPAVTPDTLHAVMNELTVIVMHVGELLSQRTTEDPQTKALREIRKAAENATVLLRRTQREAKAAR